MNQKEEVLDIREVFHIIRKHLLLILIVSVLFGAAGYGYSQWMMTPQYEADATMIVNTSESQDDTYVTYDQVLSAQQLVNTYSIILKSEAVLNQVIAGLGLDMDADSLAGSITVKGVNETEVMDITVRNSDPQLAADIANEITRVSPKVIMDKVKAGSVETISTAQKPDMPVSPRIPLDTAVAFLAGLVLSVIFSFAIEMMNNTYTSGDDLKTYLGYPVLGIIPNVKTRLYQAK